MAKQIKTTNSNEKYLKDLTSSDYITENDKRTKVSNKYQTLRIVISESSTMNTFNEVLEEYDKTFKILSDK